MTVRKRKYNTKETASFKEIKTPDDKIRQLRQLGQLGQLTGWDTSGNQELKRKPDVFVCWVSDEDITTFRFSGQGLTIEIVGPSYGHRRLADIYSGVVLRQARSGW